MTYSIKIECEHIEIGMLYAIHHNILCPFHLDRPDWFFLSWWFDRGCNYDIKNFIISEKCVWILGNIALQLLYLYISFKEMIPWFYIDIN